MLNQSRRVALPFSLLGKTFSKSLIGCKTFSTQENKMPNFQNSQSPAELKFSASRFYEQNFFHSELKSFHEARLGGLVEADQNDIEKYFPEGLAGETKDEFEFTDSSTWMVRDTGKLLCRLLDEYIAGEGKSINSIKHAKNVTSSVVVPGLTDRKEWNSATLSVKHYGKEIVNVAPKEDFIVNAGEGSLVDECMSNLSKNSNELPRRIILTGLWCWTNWDL